MRTVNDFFHKTSFDQHCIKRTIES